MSDNLPMTRSGTALVAPAGARGPTVFRRGSAMRQLRRTTRSAAELVFATADLVADRILEAIGSRSE